MSDVLLRKHDFRDLTSQDSQEIRFVDMHNQDSDLLFNAEDSPEFDVRSVGVQNLGQAYVNFVVNADINENMEKDKQKTVRTLMKDLYTTMRNNLMNRFENSDVRTEVHKNAFYSIDRYILFDIIEMGGDFESDFPIYIPPGYTAQNRGYPAYIRESDGAINPQMRQRLVEQSIDLLGRYCNVPDPYDEFVTFYNALNGSVSNFDNWPTDIKDDYSSLRLYLILLNNADQLRVPNKVAQVLKCVLVIPASTGDAERSFSAANRLSSAERSNIKTKTLDNLMTIQRNGPSVLMVKPEKLVKQWMQPLPGLGLSHRKSSSFTQEENILKEIWENVRK
ncbi:hypothetical protein Y032_1482g3891, partial [Ancylostoma ceylanicum]